MGRFARRLASLDHVAAFSEGHGHRLFDKDRLFRLGAQQRIVTVNMRRRGDVNKIDFGIGKNLREIGMLTDWTWKIQIFLSYNSSSL